MTSLPKNDPRRVHNQPAFILHTSPWSETSLLVEALTRDYGRVGLIAKGAKRPASKFRGILNPFSPLAINFTGKNEMKILTDATWLGTMPIPEKYLLAAFYLNELVIRLTARYDPSPKLFSIYLEALKALSASDAPSVALRYFERDLLEIMGYGFSGQHFPETWYGVYQGDVFSVAAPETASIPLIEGRILEDLVNSRLSPGKDEKEAKKILQEILNFYLDGKPLNTQRINQELRTL